MASSEGVRKNCLVVDDSTVNVRFLQFYLEQVGITPVIAMNAREGIEQIKKNQFDLCIIDQHMPDIKGTDLIQSCVRDGLLDKMGQIYMFTAQYDFDPELYGVSEIISGILYKPLDIADVEKILV